MFSLYFFFLLLFPRILYCHITRTTSVFDYPPRFAHFIYEILKTKSILKVVLNTTVLFLGIAAHWRLSKHNYYIYAFWCEYRIARESNANHLKALWWIFVVNLLLFQRFGESILIWCGAIIVQFEFFHVHSSFIDANSFLFRSLITSVGIS